MTFREVILKNLKAHARKYLSFLLCNTFAIMILFMYFTLLFHQRIHETITSNTRDMLMACTIAVVVFLLGFLSYAYWTFTKGRKKEWGVFQVLGMTLRDLKRLILLENSIIVLLSLTMGLVSGGVFSRLFFMASVHILGKDFIRYQASWLAYGATILVFLFIFILLNLTGNAVVKRLDTATLMKMGRKKDAGQPFRPMLLLMGVLMIFSAYFIKYGTAVRLFQMEETSTKFVLLLFPGLYILINQLAGLLERILARHTSWYHRNLLVFSEFRHQLTGNQTAVYLMSLLSALILFFMGDSYTKYLFGFSTFYYENTGSVHTVSAANELNREEGLLLLFISCFLSILFFVSASCMINFKLFNDMDQEKKRYHQLFRIGITRREVSRYLSVELKVLFFLPLLAGMMVVYPFIVVEYLAGNRYLEIIGHFSVTAAIYIFLQILFYFATRKKYVSRIIEWT